MTESKSEPKSERGTSMLLVPVMVLILMLAAGLVVDSSIAFSTKRDLAEAASAAANDASTAIERDGAYDSGSVRLDRSLAQRRAQRAVSLRANNLPADVTVATRAVTRVGRPAVQVTVEGKAKFLFAQVFNNSSYFDLSATATATLAES